MGLILPKYHKGNKQRFFKRETLLEKPRAPQSFGYVTSALVSSVGSEGKEGGSGWEVAARWTIREAATRSCGRPWCKKKKKTPTPIASGGRGKHGRHLVGLFCWCYEADNVMKRFGLRALKCARTRLAPNRRGSGTVIGLYLKTLPIASNERGRGTARVSCRRFKETFPTGGGVSDFFISSCCQGNIYNAATWQDALDYRPLLSVRSVGIVAQHTRRAPGLSDRDTEEKTRLTWKKIIIPESLTFRGFVVFWRLLLLFAATVN